MKRIKLKRISCLALLASALLGAAVSCGAPSPDPAETNGGSAVTESAQSAPETDAEPAVATLTGWFDYGTALYWRDYFTVGECDSIEIQMAKNEKEGIQYILTTDKDAEGLRCELGALSDGAGHTLTGEVNVARYLWISCADQTHGRGYTPCMLLPQDDPYQGGTFDVAKETARTIYILFETDKDTVPGTYTGTLTVTQNGETKLTGGVSVRVRDIYYDEKTECLTAIGLAYDPNDPNPSVHPGPDSAPELLNGNELQKIYADFMLDNRMSPSDIPYADALLDEECVEYLKNPRVTMVQLAMRSKLREQYRIAEENDLFGKIYFSFFDEPHQEDQIEIILQSAAALSPKNYPGFRAMDALLVDLPKDGRNIIERLSDVTTMYCPKVQFFTGEIRDTMLRLKEERGDTLFWYVCSGGTVGTINRLPCTPGTDKRVLFWQQYQQNVDGFLYWRATYWNDHEDVWDPDYMKIKRKFPYGGGWPTDEGVMLYWHPTTGMPVSTLGFEAMRDGIEDFQLFKMAEARFGREKVLSYVEQITTDPTVYIRYEDGSTPIVNDLKNQIFDLLDP